MKIVINFKKNDEIQNIVSYFVEKHGKSSRFDLLTSILDELEINYNIQKAYGESIVRNIVIRFGSKIKPALVLGAHYDVWGTSIGINDNTVAVATLISLAIDLMKINEFNKPVEIVFFDKEEVGMVGSRLYAQSNPIVDFAFVLDIIGYGNTKLICGVSDNEIISPQISHLIEQEFKYMNSDLPSDNLILKYRFPTKLIIATPESDLVREDYEQRKVSLKSDPNLFSSFHNGENDNDIEKINWQIANEIKGDLWGLIIRQNN